VTGKRTYEGYIARTIGPVLGELPVRKIDARVLETFYAELRRCRARCNGTPFIEHKKDDEHDREKAKCKPHKCNPMAAGTVRQIHAIISGSLDAAVRWTWIDSNPARIARKPKQKAPKPDPPTAGEAARLERKGVRAG
jgi:hypothetical protein